jgi:hypothetical protein
MRQATQAEMNKDSQTPLLVLGYAFRVALHSTHTGIWRQGRHLRFDIPYIQ